MTYLPLTRGRSAASGTSSNGSMLVRLLTRRRSKARVRHAVVPLVTVVRRLARGIRHRYRLVGRPRGGPVVRMGLLLASFDVVIEPQPPEHGGSVHLGLAQGRNRRQREAIRLDLGRTGQVHGRERGQVVPRVAVLRRRRRVRRRGTMGRERGRVLSLARSRRGRGGRRRER